MRLSPSPEMFRKLDRQTFSSNSSRGGFDVVRNSNKRNNRLGAAEVDGDITRPWITILRPSDAAGIDEMHSTNDPVPRLVSVTESDEVPRAGTGLLGHPREERITAILRHVYEVVRRGSVEERETATGNVTTSRPYVDAKRQRPEAVFRRG